MSQEPDRTTAPVEWQRAVLRDNLWTWTQASGLQLDRLQAAAERLNSFTAEDDAARAALFARLSTEFNLFMIAIRNADRSAMALGELAVGEERDAIEAAIEAARVAAPNARRVRDYIEHFDEYVVGVGRDKMVVAHDLGEVLFEEPFGHVISFRVGALFVEPAHYEAAVREMAQAVLDVVNSSLQAGESE